MTIPTNWPNPERPGVPLWSNRYGKHVLFNKNTGDDVIGDWNQADEEWLLPNGSLKARNAAKHYVYSHCASIELTPTQISEMLAAERERCADVCRAMSFDNAYERPARATLEVAETAIRNLGAVS